MSEPKRYHLEMQKADDGDWVLYEDYARLKAEVEAWKDMVADSGVACNERARENQDLENQIERLKAEVERLTKAGDTMAGVVGLPVNSVQSSALIQNWNAAKEGKQP